MINPEDLNKPIGEALKSSLVLFSTDDQRLKAEVNPLTNRFPCAFKLC